MKFFSVQNLTKFLTSKIFREQFFLKISRATFSWAAHGFEISRAFGLASQILLTNELVSNFFLQKFCMKYFVWKNFFGVTESFIFGFSWLSWMFKRVLNLLLPDSWLYACDIACYFCKSFPIITVTNDEKECKITGTKLYETVHTELVMSNWLELPKKIFTQNLIPLCFSGIFRYGSDSSTSVTSRPGFSCQLC